MKRILASLLLVTMTACQTMRPVPGAPDQYINTYQPKVIWVSTSDTGLLSAVEAPRVMGDTIVGFVEGEFTEYPLAQISSVRARQFSQQKTTLFVLAAAAVGLGLTQVISGGRGGDNQDDLIDSMDWGLR